MKTYTLCGPAGFCGLLFTLLLTPVILSGQDTSPVQLENAIERLMENSQAESDHPEWTEELSNLNEHPVNLNNTRLEELLTIPDLSQKQADGILNYLMNYGEFLSVYELCTIAGFDSLSVSRIIPYITLGSGPEPHPLKLKKIFREGHARLLANYQQVLQKQAGYHVPDSVLSDNPEAGYPGEPQKYWFRLEYHYYDRIDMGISGVKDAGEQFFRGDQKYGMDFYSGYFRLRNTGFLKELIIGNFRADFGQGLVLGSGSAYGSSAGSPDMMRYAAGLRPSLSTNETSCLRGFASQFRFGKFDISLFYSNHKTDSRIREAITGANLNYRNRYMSAGFTGFYTSLSAAGKPEQVPYKLFTFAGKENLNLGFDFRVIAGSIYFFGEAGRSMNGGMAWMAGMQFSPDPCSAVSFLYRDYRPDYQDLLSNATGRNTPNANEKGFQVKANVQVSKQITVRGYADIFSFPWLKYRTDFPSKGHDYLVEGDFNASRSISMYLQFRSDTRQINVTGSDYPVKRWINCQSYSFRYQLNWQITTSFLMRSRFEILENHKEQDPAGHGYLIYQDFVYKPVRFPLSLFFRYALFSTDSWDERIYTYEPDVLYGYSVPALEGEGIRCCLMVTWKALRKIDLSVRYVQTWYTDRDVIGTGLDEIYGNLKSELKIQGRIHL